MAKEQSIRQAQADHRHAYRVSLKFNRVFDMEIVDWLKRQDNKQEAIRQAILHYMSEDTL